MVSVSGKTALIDPQRRVKSRFFKNPNYLHEIVCVYENYVSFFCSADCNQICTNMKIRKANKAV